MAVPAINRVSFSWTRALAAMSFLAAAWAAVQAVFLALALSQGPPSPGSQLVFEYRDQAFVYFLVLHGAAFVVFALGGIFAGRVCGQVSRMDVSARRTWTQIGYGAAYILPVLALFVVFQVSNDYPRYHIYVDDSLQKIIRTETRLMPQGVSESSVAFSDIRVIEGKMDYGSWLGDRYFLRVVTMDWEVMEIGQGGRGESPELLFSLARAIADSAGAEVDLSSKLPQFR